MSAFQCIPMYSLEHIHPVAHRAVVNLITFPTETRITKDTSSVNGIWHILYFFNGYSVILFIYCVMLIFLKCKNTKTPVKEESIFYKRCSLFGCPHGTWRNQWLFIPSSTTISCINLWYARFRILSSLVWLSHGWPITVFVRII